MTPLLRILSIPLHCHHTTTQDTQYTTTLSCEHYGSVLVTHTLAQYTISRDQDTRQSFQLVNSECLDGDIECLVSSGDTCEW